MYKIYLQILKLFAVTFALVYCLIACKNPTYYNLDNTFMHGVFQAHLPNDGEFFLNTQNDINPYCVVCRNGDADSISIDIKGGVIKRMLSDDVFARIEYADNGMKIILPELTDDNSEFDLVPLQTDSVEKETMEIDTSRYLLPVYGDSVIVKKNIIYSVQDGFYSSLPMGNMPTSNYASYIKAALDSFRIDGVRPLELMLDVYSLASDAIHKRPLIILLHGGAFLFGDKSGDFMQHFGLYFASRGYVVASVNYRLGCSLLGIPAFERTIYRAVQDALNAGHFLLNNSVEYGIDPNAIFLMGHSAGAITALTASVMTNDERYASASENFIREDLGYLNSPINLLGTVGLWGAVTDLSLIDVEDNPDFLLLHGTADNIVPYHIGLPFEAVSSVVEEVIGIKMIMYGSAAIAESMENKNMPCTLYSFHGMKHDPHLDEDGHFNENIDIVDSVTTQYFYRQLDNLGPDIEVRETGEYTAVFALVNTKSDIVYVTWEVVGAVIINKLSDIEIECCRFTNAPEVKIVATIVLANGKVVRREV